MKCEESNKNRINGFKNIFKDIIPYALLKNTIIKEVKFLSKMSDMHSKLENYCLGFTLAQSVSLGNRKLGDFSDSPGITAHASSSTSKGSEP